MNVNVAIIGLELILCDNMGIFDRFRPSAIFYYIEQLFILKISTELLLF